MCTLGSTSAKHQAFSSIFIYTRVCRRPKHSSRQTELARDPNTAKFEYIQFFANKIRLQAEVASGASRNNNK